VSSYDLTGFVSGITAASLFGLAVLVAVAASLRLLLVLGRPAKGRWARGLIVAAGIVGLAGIVLFAGAELAPTAGRHALDRAAPWIALASIAGAGLEAARVARRGRHPPASADAPPPTGPPGAGAPQA
jgi:hypothetical protein